METDYPVRFDVDYPDRDLDRVSTFFRVFAAIPISIVIGSIGGIGWYFADTGPVESILVSITSFGGILAFPLVLMILFEKKYPRWWFDWNLEFARFSNRVGVYLALLDDQYPSTDEPQAVRLDIDYPDAANDLGRGMPLIKWLAAIPHWFILGILFFASFFAVVGAWFAILFTGRYPRGLFDFVVGVTRWWNRVNGYAFLMVTDRYPPFSLEP